MSLRTAPCQWPLAPLTCDALDDLDYGLDDDIRQMATSRLWNWTGRVFGLCELTIRPCKRRCPESETTYAGATGVPGTPGPWRPVLIDGDWINLRCGRCGDVCSCTTVSSIRLPGPVDSIVSVVVDGATVDPSAYRVDNRSQLVRQDGSSWPDCQDLSKPAGEVGTWSVTYKRGVPVPKGGQVAAAMLACEMAKAIVAPKDCQLPRRVIQSVTREGITLGFDLFEDIEKGKTGIWMVDDWVASVVHRPKRSQVMSPDTMRPRSTTDT